jgi:RHS repeat-associated protein
MQNKWFFRLLLVVHTLLIGMARISFAQSPFWNPAHSIGTSTGKYHFSYNQTPDPLMEINYAGLNLGLTYQWESSSNPLTGFAAINSSPASLAQQSTYTIPAPLTQTTYYRRKTANSLGMSIYSNVVKIQVVSVNWEDRNYTRQHDVATTGITTWQAVDQLPIGQKTQATSYLDGLGRQVKMFQREVATPSQAGGLWGDIVQFSNFDVSGRQPLSYLPFTTTNQSGKFKTNVLADQAQYYSTKYNQSQAYTTNTVENSPLGRLLNFKEAGAAWAAGAGSSIAYDLNTLTDNVQNFGVDYVQGNPPVNKGTFPANTLYKLTYIDVNNKKVVEYLNKTGHVVLKKVQLDNNPTEAHTGWICTYTIYDDLGLVRYQLQPEAVKYLDVNNWSFAGTNGLQVLNEMCFQYNYDERGMIIWSKRPGAMPVTAIYDDRNRVVFIQDGNQAALAMPQWTANIYDDQDRVVIMCLYNTTKTIAELKAAIAGATITQLTTTIPSQPITNLAVDQRLASVSSYRATTTVELVAGFESLPNDEFVAEINAGATSSATSVATTRIFNSIPATELNNPAICTILKYKYYDNYAFNKAKGFNTNYKNLTAYSTSDPDVQPIATSKRVYGMPTGEATRILGTDKFLTNTILYDEKGQIVQIHEENIKNGVDVSTMQYHFDGRLLSMSVDHTAPGTSSSNLVILNKYISDKLGRTTAIQKVIGDNPFKTIVAYDYDDAGRVKTNRFDPDYTAGGNSGLESLNYSFNIHSQITGVNKDYALKTSGSYDKWGHFFGMYMGFENADGKFAGARLNGQLTGVMWNTQGDDAQRRYDYTYDNANRLTQAAFLEQQHTGDGWNNNKMDFSVGGAAGQMTYDLNGNLLNMQHKGVMPGSSAPAVIDNLSYSYFDYSNRLKAVTDQMTATAINGKSGDFKDGSNGSTPDYVYDNNGNIIVDLNKSVQSLGGGAAGTKGISYNHLDKPEVIRIVGKGTVRVIYNADGFTLQKVFIPESGQPARITTNIKDFIYQETSPVTVSTPAPLGTGGDLSSINFEEGRIRVITPLQQDNGYDALTISGNLALPNGKMGVYDYQITDFQGNVRMVLTEEMHAASNKCTMETDRAAAEGPVFGQTGAANEVETTRFAKPAGWTSPDIGNAVSRLGNIAGVNLGPNTLQKVMAGDKISAAVQYFYLPATGGSNPNLAAAILSSLGQSLSGSTIANPLVKANAAAITSQLNGTVGFINAVQPTGTGTTPQAYLTILFFDERFKFIEAADGGVAQQQVAASVGNAGAPLGLGNIKAPKNGYAFVYVSNRSDQDVYFDNLQVGIVRGNIIEENHYYAYGLKIAGISSQKPAHANEGKLSNPYLYNGKELIDEESELNVYDYGFRSYDPQIARFLQQDPLTEEYIFLSPYVYAACDPANNIDVGGLFGGIATTASAAKAMQEVVVVGYRATSIAATSVAKVALSVTSISIQTAVTAANIINTGVNAAQAGDLDPYQMGMRDALWNANTFGVSGFFNSLFWSDEVDDLDDAQKLQYYKGKAAGDAIAIAQSIIEIESGGGTAAIGAATGVGAIVAVPAGGAIAGHGALVGAAASADLALTTIEILRLESVLKATSSPKMNAPAAKEPPAKMNAKPKQANKPTLEPYLEGADHHLSTDKFLMMEPYWTFYFEDIFRKGFLDLRTAPENLVWVLNHKGPHPEEYHIIVYNRLTQALKSSLPFTLQYKDKLIGALQKLKKEAVTPGSPLNKLITRQ